MFLVRKSSRNVSHNNKKTKKDDRQKKRQYESDDSGSESDTSSCDTSSKKKVKSIFDMGCDPNVYNIDNHIYFNSTVNEDSIQELSELIYQMNADFESLCNETKVATLTPKPIYLHITTHGGCLLSGFKAIDVIENSKIPIHTVVEGYAVSAGTLMVLAGKQRLMMKNSYMLFHQLSTGGKFGTFESQMDDFENSTTFMNKLYDFYTVKSNGKITKSKIKEALRRDIFWDIDTCKRYGFIDGAFVG